MCELNQTKIIIICVPIVQKSNLNQYYYNKQNIFYIKLMILITMY